MTMATALDLEAATSDPIILSGPTAPGGRSHPQIPMHLPPRSANFHTVERAAPKAVWVPF